MTKPHPHISQMAPYALADIHAPEGIELLSLSQNESLRSPSPKAIKAAQQSLVNASDYPDPDWSDFRIALGELHTISAENILCGNGSLDLIGCITRVFAGPERSVLAPAHAYPFFKSSAQMANARFDTASETDCTVKVDAMLEAVQPDTALVFVANPGNPTGTRISKAELLRLRAGLRKDILLVIDEAYGEFCENFNETCWDMTELGDCIVLRTLSKAYSMAGFRVGWGLFPPRLAQDVRKVMNPNNLTHASQAAALAAVKDQTYMRETCALTAKVREEAKQDLVIAGFRVVPSVTNFLLIQFDDADQAEAADAALRAQGIFLRQQQGAGLANSLRMTIGPAAATQAAVDGLKCWKDGNQT